LEVNLGGEFIEKTLDSGLLIRVNMQRGSFSLINSDEGEQDEIKLYPVNHVVFLGERFQFDPQEIDIVRFLPVKLGKVEIPFLLAEKSDVRHYRLPVSISSEEVPVMIFHFPAYWPGPLPALNLGARIFIFDPAVDSESIVRIKGKFPKAKAYVYREQNLGRVRLETSLGANAPSNVRAVDYVIDDDVDFISKDPVFAARVFLRRLELQSMHTLPVLAMMSQADVEKILTFITLMLSNAEDSIELSPHRKKLEGINQLYVAIKSILMFDMPQVKRWQQTQKGINMELFEELIKITKAQKVFYERGEMKKKAEFLGSAISLLENRSYSISSKNINQN
jgi:hypothetical protein